MYALSVLPGVADSARLTEVPEPDESEGAILASTLAVGVCGTDREILAGEYGSAPPGHDRLILGHESLAEVIEAPPNSEVRAGDLIVGIVRRPDPLPCAACSVGEWDMCRNGGYTEHGIKQLHGFCAQRFRVDENACVRIDASLRDTGVLLEPTSVVAKAWDHIERIGKRSQSWRARRVLITGAGPIGLLAALMASQQDLELHVYDHNAKGLKPELVKRLGGTYHSGSVEDACSIAADVIIECTGAAPVIGAVIARSAAAGIVCLTGLSSGAHRVPIDLNELNRSMVLENDVVFGTVNANRAHYVSAAAALARADQDWLRALITRRVPIHEWARAIEHQPDDIKVVIDFTLT
jgi:threonine dehydrogenase-like Zn-dependent dehydrogenase